MLAVATSAKKAQPIASRLGFCVVVQQQILSFRIFIITWGETEAKFLIAFNWLQGNLYLFFSKLI